MCACRHNSLQKGSQKSIKKSLFLRKSVAKTRNNFALFCKFFAIFLQM